MQFIKLFSNVNLKLFYHFFVGDIGYYDEDCYVYIVDRIKELIKYKGFQVICFSLSENRSNE